MPNDGTHLDADIVVLVLGYANMRETVCKVLGDKVADKLKDVGILIMKESSKH
jgi:hypothetical protein